VIRRGLTGLIAERAIEECNIIVNKNRIPGDAKSARITSGLRLGTNCLALRGMGTDEMPTCSKLIDQVLSNVSPRGESEYRLDAKAGECVRMEVNQLCRRFPIPDYSTGAALSSSGTHPRHAGL